MAAPTASVPTSAVGRLLTSLRQLNDCQTHRLASNSLAAIHKAHNKIRKHPAAFDVKLAKKCRKAYKIALEQSVDEKTLIDAALLHLDVYAATLAPSRSPEDTDDNDNNDDDDARKKRRKTDAETPLSTTGSLEMGPLLPKGTFVAARTGNNMWILATIVAYLADKNRYEVEDAEPDLGTSSRKRYRLLPSNILALTGKPKFEKGTEVLALFPDTSCFYHAKVLHYADGEYTLQFEDDGDQQRHVPDTYVVKKC